MSKLFITGFLEKLEKLNKSNPLSYMTNGSKENLFWVLSNGLKDTQLQQCLLNNLYLFDSLFSGVV